ncbi:hypothetical protein CMQ_4775 [Grosmannia clavigera kw1407]|uniref:Selenoprotein O n=1 Tax=Grosmannia clavigera (strain kw1407 / UAMH 11150) TaxID=655863 RepID=F0XTH6_GROCL|nr:uncharacterized protein CMQ_4775 [Grosmannia clavigera kw1407]EFW98923.1 hypothetical protein CMQ_4775 [Grosmannia clavigera kw1407]
MLCRTATYRAAAPSLSLSLVRVYSSSMAPSDPSPISAPTPTPSAPPTSSTLPSHTLASLPKTWRFTQSLPTDPHFPTPAASHNTPRDDIQPRLVRGALFSWVRPEEQDDPELLAVSPAALRDLGLRPGEAQTEDFRQTAAGNRLWGWDSGEEKGGKDDEQARFHYPWAQCYGGFQFGQWAGQLGDGRAISLFEVPIQSLSSSLASSSFSPLSPSTPSYEIQLKGAGITPYSRFADGRAVLRSSIREFVASEALHALHIPSTRALALTLLPEVLVHRERLEPAAVVVRFAESWLRLGTFDLLRARGDAKLTRQLATYAAETVFGGWDKLPGRVSDDLTSTLSPPRNVPLTTTEGPLDAAENRFARLYREVVRRNAITVARWQAYGFMNGVLNTDNTSLVGLSMDFGPFAFLDNFDPDYTPNHDDDSRRYSYKNQPSVVSWNLVRFGEALGELIAAADRVDHPAFVEGGITGLATLDAAAEGDITATPPKEAVQLAADVLSAHAENVILRSADEYKTLFLAEYKRLFAARLGLSPPSLEQLAADADIDPLLLALLDLMQSLALDFNLFFRRLSSLRLQDLADDPERLAAADIFFYRDGLESALDKDDARRQIARWLAQWRERLLAQHSYPDDDARIRAMKAVNPNFTPRGWILDELIRRVEKDNDRDVLRRITHMALHPFSDSWHGQSFDGQIYLGDPDEETRWTQDVPQKDRAMQCSCSS